MAVMDNLSARLTPEGRGRAQVYLIGFNALKHIPNYRQELKLLFVRRGSEEHLGDWPTQGADPMGFVTIKPIAPEQKGLDFKFIIDGAIVDALAYDNTDNFLLKLHTVDASGQDVIRTLNVDVQRKNGRGLEANLTRTATTQPTPQPTTQPTPQANFSVGGPAVPPSAPAAAPAKSGGNGLFKLLGLLLLLIILGVGGYFLWQMFAGSFGGSAAPEAEQTEEQAEEPTEEEAAEEETAVEEPVEEPAPQESLAADTGMVSDNAACRIAGVKGDERDILNMCLATKPSKEDLTGMLAEALRLERCEIAQRILRTLGRAPDGTAFAFVYATFADPNNVAQTKCIVKRDSDAQYWATRVKNDHNFNPADGMALLQQLTAESKQ